ncbi:hypothetical protein [Lysinibacillus sp. LZ02]|uniref:hypothetical protein n=1 Tax=Lysinibacillus sp. LZ02 TaxID=3420668 RepID=UPI003D35E955
MNGRVLAHALLQTTGQELRMVYALLCKTNIIDMLTAKTKDFFSKDIDNFNEALKEEVKKLERYSDIELQVKLLTEMTRVLDINGMRYDCLEDIETQSEVIVQATHQQMLKSDKDYAAFIELANEQEAYQLMIQYQMQKLFAAFDAKFRELSEEQSTNFTEKIQQLLTGLPIEKQQQLKQSLDIAELTHETLRMAILTQGSVIVLSMIVEVAGFSAYTTLTTAIASTMALSGVALPFGVYTVATALFSMMMSPFMLIPLALGGGGLLLKHQNKHVKKKLLPLGILQLTLPIVAQNRIGQIDSTPFTRHWQQQVKRYEELFAKREDYKVAIHQQQLEITEHEEAREKHVRQMELDKEKVQAYKAFIGKYIATVPKEERTPLLQEGIDWLIIKESERAALNNQQEENRGRKGLWQVIASSIDNTKLKARKKQIQKDIDEKLKVLTEAFLEMDSSVLQAEREQIQLYQASATLHREKALDYEELVTTGKEKLKELKTRLKITHDQIGTLQDEYYGLEDVD